MPVAINYLDDGLGVEFKASGTVTGREIIEANERVYVKDSVGGLKYQVVDRTDCTEYLVSSAEMRQISQQEIEASKTNPGLTIIVVAPSVHQFGMSRMYQAMSQKSGFEIVIFQDRQSADAFIDETFHQHYLDT